MAQGLIALATVVMPPAIAAISVGLVGPAAFARRMGRNEAYSHAGAVFAALLAGAIAYSFATVGLFYFAAAMSVAGAIAAWCIRPEEIDPALAREAALGRGGRPEIVAIGGLLRDSRIAIFAAAVTLFHLANAAMLPLVGEMLSAGRPTLAAPYMSACIVIAQLVMAPVAVVAGRLADVWGRKPVFLLALAALAMRGVLFAITRKPYLVVPIQILDGVGAGIFGVVAVIIVADLARHTGRFNLLQGAMNTCVAVGAALSNLGAGVVANRYGYDRGFLLLSACALGALGFFWLAMPETAERRPPPA
jgi:hypothetical protein